MSSVFCRYSLRTTDPKAAERFYSEVVGLDFAEAPSSEEAPMLEVWLLHEQARARGARAHWLGQIGVADLDADVQRLLDRGSERLGPTARAKDGAAFTVLRDPSGAVVGLRESKQRARCAPVAWHHLHTKDLDQAWATYAELFGWRNAGTFQIADPVGECRMFAWDDDRESVGSMANTARAPGVHPHWLFFFPVADIDGTLERVRAQGGSVSADVTVLPNGDRIAPCQDEQGAAFGLHQAATSV